MRIAVVGGFGFGLTIYAPRYPEPGETLPGGRFAASPGGKGSNQAVAAARLGAEVSLLSATGKDSYGTLGRKLWIDEGVDSTHIPTFDDPSMVGVIIVDPAGENRIVLAEGALARLGPSDVEPFEVAIASADVLLISTEIPAEVAATAVRLGARHDVRIVLNPAPVIDLPPETLSLVDVLTPNRSEAAQLAGNKATDPEKIATQLHRRHGLCQGIRTVPVVLMPR